MFPCSLAFIISWKVGSFIVGPWKVMFLFALASFRIFFSAFGFLPVRSSGRGKDNPLQYSCLGNPMDREVWWATVNGVAKSQTWLGDWATCPERCMYVCVFILFCILHWFINWGFYVFYKICNTLRFCLFIYCFCSTFCFFLWVSIYYIDLPCPIRFIFFYVSFPLFWLSVFQSGFFFWPSFQYTNYLFSWILICS